MADLSRVKDTSAVYVPLCNICNKPTTSASALKRHVAYCRRTLGKPKKRKRSCKRCREAKAKCSFEPQCHHCRSRGLVCEYEEPVGVPSVRERNPGIQDTRATLSDPPEIRPGGILDGWLGRPEAAASVYDGTTTATNMQALRSLADIRADPRHQESIIFLLETFRALPQMMTRRETFPVFIHGHWHMTELPEAIVKCMSISQLYIKRGGSRSSHAIYRSTLDEEISRALRLVPNLTGLDLLATFETQVVYALLSALEDDRPDEESLPELSVESRHVDRATRIGRVCFEQDGYAPFDIDRVCDPSETWEQFIYAESRRRCALVWFLASRVIDLKFGSKCPPVRGYRGLALPCPDALWVARRRDEFEAARAEMLERCIGSGPRTSLRTLGDLVDVRSCSDANSRRKLSSWFASCGELGMMLFMASGLI
ncbi:hypothetical protein F5Y17DRAFT_215760 [Xylariaceae sp. FL0594]|nr:hypothetical protein F5Y17DRAFT_215760 [Xylariaceae sp. FL0594]